MLEVRGLTLKYGQSQILYDVDLTAEAGRVTAVMGTNGVGKTSLLKAISGRHPYDRGTITLNGRELVHASAHAAAKAGVAYVPQGREIFPLLSVTENLESGFACLGRAERGVPERIYELFPVLKEMAGRRGGDLSGGQQQQLAIARALITRPKVLLLDEPTEGIQPNIIKQIGHVIAQLRDEGEMAVVLVEQFFDFAYELADHFVAIRRGAVEMNEPRAEVDRERLLACVTI
ncbi:urea ABC transporter ATP-binding subunit UrtE [Pseudoroseicyclus tamaricis]|uniref:Urea ABC transporter ATP-binding subunit UrtE n=1 Tax=Pseudoroseicyclus tamaricis TaxID=2705421 RepID=A0A6B2JNX5_9RHOB|nr:urea ABC transporter ATP-binding subunit UrtE [Pseudoroseicyclus tamaricis]NDU99689.1 urea ABC transporter ATP-binding subunit UrtE [Pseudoroseicyclus tamaricis]